MRSFKANRPCAVSAGAEAAAMVDSVDLKIERLLVRKPAQKLTDAIQLRAFGRKKFLIFTLLDQIWRNR